MWTGSSKGVLEYVLEDIDIRDDRREVFLSAGDGDGDGDRRHDVSYMETLALPSEGAATSSHRGTRDVVHPDPFWSPSPCLLVGRCELLLLLSLLLLLLRLLLLLLSVPEKRATLSRPLICG